MPDTGAPYSLRFPADTDVASVPADMQRLAADVSNALNGKVSGIAADAIYQRKILVTTSLPTSGVAEGDIVFLIAP